MSHRHPLAPLTFIGLTAFAALAGFALTAPAFVQAQDVSDADIAAIVVAANQADIDNGELAVEKASNDRVRAFGQQMIEAHTAVNESAARLVADLGVTPTPNDISRSIADGQATERAKLGKLSGAAFDRAYIDNEIAYHEAVIDAVKNVLIPGATNDRLKQTLIDVSPAFVSHLEQARSIGRELGGT